MSDLLPLVTAAIARDGLIAPGATVVVGVSGGADSLTLLHLLVRLRDELDLTLIAATLDHGLRGAAGAADAEFSRQTAEAWGVPAIVGRADVPALAAARRLNVEEAARQVRYTFLLHAARQVGAETVAVGHHRDDQAETVLMHLIRGSGLSGLRGMLPRLRLSDYHLLPDAPITLEPSAKPATPDRWPWLVRPLLDVPRAAIDAYAEAHGFQPRVDATNAELTFFRNRLRHEVLPLLETLNPNVRAVLARTARVLQADAEIVQAAGDAALARIALAIDRDAIVLDRGGWGALSLSEKRSIVRHAVGWLRPDLRDVGFEQVDAALRVADEGPTGAAATLPGGLMLRVRYATLVIAGVETAIAPAEEGSAPALDPGEELSFRAGEPVRQAFGAWTFEAELLPPDADLAAWHGDPLAAALAVPPDAPLVLRTRRPGERFQPRGMGGRSQKLSDTLINMKVPAAWRDRVPLLAVGDAIAWFVAPSADGLRGRVAEPFATPGTARSRWIGVRWRRGE